MLAIALCLPVLVMPLATAAATEVSAISVENRLKAASLFRFLGYVEWPASNQPERDFHVIGVIDAADIAEELTVVAAGRRVNDRTVVVRRMSASEAPGDVDELFIGTSDLAQVRAIIGRVRNSPVLIVTQAEHALAHGSMVNFRIADDRLRFEVALDNAEQAGLRVSSRMLSVALRVVRPSIR